jgi:hypothetical protein
MSWVEEWTGILSQLFLVMSQARGHRTDWQSGECESFRLGKTWLGLIRLDLGYFGSNFDVFTYCNLWFIPSCRRRGSQLQYTPAEVKRPQ